MSQTDFHKSRSDCKSCHRKVTRERDLRVKYSLTVSDYSRMLAYQGGVCWICGNPPKTVPLNVDHDHKTGKVRGLLCWHCNNRLLGASRDRPELLRRAALYLEQPPAVNTLGVNHPGAPKKAKKRVPRKAAAPAKAQVAPGKYS